MPLFHYCASAGCGAKIAYEAIKPSVCPKCRKPIKDPMAILAQATAAAVAAPASTEQIEDDEAPIQPIARSLKSRPVSELRKPQRPQRVYASEDQGPDEPDDDDDGEDDGSESYDPRTTKRIARELAASIDPDSFRIVGDGDGERVTFGDWCGRKKGGR
jgi:hypothetical protein